MKTCNDSYFLGRWVQLATIFLPKLAGPTDDGVAVTFRRLFHRDFCDSCEHFEIESCTRSGYGVPTNASIRLPKFHEWETRASSTFSIGNNHVSHQIWTKYGPARFSTPGLSILPGLDATMNRHRERFARGGKSSFQISSTVVEKTVRAEREKKTGKVSYRVYGTRDILLVWKCSCSHQWSRCPSIFCERRVETNNSTESLLLRLWYNFTLLTSRSKNTKTMRKWKKKVIHNVETVLHVHSSQLQTSRVQHACTHAPVHATVGHSPFFVSGTGTCLDKSQILSLRHG